MSATESGVDPWRDWSQDTSQPPADWATVFALCSSALCLIRTLDAVLADIGAAGPVEAQDATFALRGMVETAEHVFGQVADGWHRAGQTSPPAGRPVTVVCDVDDDPPELLVVLSLADGQNPYLTVDERLTAAGVGSVTPMLAFTGDITSLVTAGSGLRILRLPA